MVESSLLILGVTQGISALKKAIKSLKKKTSKKKYKKLISSAVFELLKLDPDISAAEASILAAEATDEDPSPELLRAKSMLGKAKTYKTAKKM